MHLQFPIKNVFSEIRSLPFIKSNSTEEIVSICLNCGKLQGEFPITNKTIRSLNLNDEDESPEEFEDRSLFQHLEEDPF